MRDFLNVITPPTEFSNTAYAVFWVERTDTVELESRISIPSNTDLFGSVSISNTEINNLNSSFNINRPYISSSMEIERNSISASYTILPYNKMYAIFEMLAPPRINEYLMPIQDTMIRSDRQTMNFGYNELSIGYDVNKDTIARTLMRWDLTNILPPRLAFIEAKLILKFIDTYQDMNFSISKVESYWQEYTTTWKSQPIKGELVGEYTVVDGQMVLEIDAMDLIKDWYENPLDNYGIMIQSLDESLNVMKRFGSKEMEGFEPILYIQYIDPVTPEFKRIGLDSSIRIAKHLETEVPASIEINSIYQDVGLPSNVKIHIPDTLETSIDIERNSINGSLTVWSNTDLPASINVPILYDIDLNSNLNIANLFVKSNIEIERNTIPCSISIPETLEEELISNLNICKQYLNSSIEIVSGNTLTSLISISGIEESNLNAELNISKLSMDSSIEIVSGNTLNCSLSIPIIEQENLNSNLSITKDSVNGEVIIAQSESMTSNILISSLVSPSSNIEGKIRIALSKEEQISALLNISMFDSINSTMSIAQRDCATPIDCDLNITKQQLQSSVNITKDNIYSSITIGRECVPSSVNITKDNIYGSLGITHNTLFSDLCIIKKEVPSSLTITGSKIIVGTMKIIVYNQTSIAGNLDISIPELKSSIKIVANKYIPAKMSISDINSIRGSLFIPHYGENQLDGELFILSNRFIPVRMFLRSPYLRSNMTIQRIDIENLKCSILVRDIYPCLESEISIASPESEDLLSCITIKNPLDNNERAYWFVV